MAPLWEALNSPTAAWERLKRGFVQRRRFLCRCADVLVSIGVTMGLLVVAQEAAGSKPVTHPIFPLEI
jgi:hypothetical protein